MVFQGVFYGFLGYYPRAPNTKTKKVRSWSVFRGVKYLLRRYLEPYGVYI